MTSRTQTVALPRTKKTKAFGARTNTAYAYLAPGLVFIGLSTVIGVVYSLYISFTNYDGLTHFNHWSWVGFRNYHAILVGTDGSDTALTALRQAIALAARTGARLQIVSAYEPVSDHRLRNQKIEVPKDL